MHDLSSTERFSNRVDNYVKYQPHYPEKIIDYLNETIHFNSSFIVADIGAGTGFLTQLFLQNGNKVFGVEPNAAMLLKAEELLNKYENFKSISATAEATTLEDESIDLITAAQAFHWFDKDKTKKEFERIAKQNAYCLLVWNDREMQTDFEKDYEKFLVKYATDYTNVNHTYLTPEKVALFFSPQKMLTQKFYNEQQFDFDSLKGRLLSSSYISLEQNQKYFSMIEELKTLFDKYQRNNAIRFNYTTNLFLGKMK